MPILYHAWLSWHYGSGLLKMHCHGFCKEKNVRVKMSKNSDFMWIAMLLRLPLLQ